MDRKFLKVPAHWLPLLETAAQKLAAIEPSARITRAFVSGGGLVIHWAADAPADFNALGEIISETQAKAQGLGRLRVIDGGRNADN